MTECVCGWKLPKEWAVGIKMSEAFWDPATCAMRGTCGRLELEKPVERAVVVVTCPCCGTTLEHDAKVEELH